jgi:multiple sugar transport system permease protein
MKKILLYGPLWIGALITIFPIFWIYSGAFKTAKEIVSYPPIFFPSDPTLNNLITLFQEHSFGRSLLNSIIVAGTIAVVALFIHAMAAYSLSRLKIPGRDWIFLAMIATMLVPRYGTDVPRFLIVKIFGWIDTYAGLIIPPIPHAFGIFALRQFFLSIPETLEEAAILEGASRIHVFFKIVLPLSKGILFTLGLLFFIFNWDAFMWPLIITNSEELRVTQVAISHFRSHYLTQWDMILAGSAITITPLLLMFFIFQRYIIQGIKTTGLKY